MTLKDSDYLTNIYILYAPITQCSSNEGHDLQYIKKLFMCRILYIQLIMFLNDCTTALFL